MISTPAKNSTKMIRNQKLLEFNGYVKVEKNGIEIKNKVLQNSSNLMLIIISEKTYWQEDNKEQTVKLLEIRDKKRELGYYCKLSHWIRVVDKFINEGKITLIFQKDDKEKNVIFISKSTKELLESFLNKLLNRSSETPVTEDQSCSTNQTSINQLTNNNNLKGKRKYNELLKEKKLLNSSAHAMNLKLNTTNQEQRLNWKIIPNLIFESFPYSILYVIFPFLDKKTIITKTSLLNKYIKKCSDDFIETWVIRDDTPSKIFSKIIIRFQRAKSLIFGKAKHFKNENIKCWDTNLPALQHMDISYIDNWSDTSIKGLFSKTRIGNILSLKVNFYLLSLYTALIYILDFYKKWEEWSIVNYSFDGSEKALNLIWREPKWFNPHLFRTLNKILLSQMHSVKILKIFLYNTSTSTATPFQAVQLKTVETSPFVNWLEWSIEVIWIENWKDLKCFYKLNQLHTFKLGAIAKKTPPTIKGYPPSFTYIDLNSLQYEIEAIDNNDNNLGSYEIDFDNDYIEIFGRIFYGMRSNLRYLSLGQFVNDDICKLISAYLKSIEKLDLSSEQVTDHGIKDVLFSCQEIIYLDLEDCTRFLGEVFNEIPKKLKVAKFSIQTHNYYHVINHLRLHGIKADNYIHRLNKYNN